MNKDDAEREFPKPLRSLFWLLWILSPLPNELAEPALRTMAALPALWLLQLEAFHARLAETLHRPAPSHGKWHSIAS